MNSQGAIVPKRANCHNNHTAQTLSNAPQAPVMSVLEGHALPAHSLSLLTMHASHDKTSHTTQLNSSIAYSSCTAAAYLELLLALVIGELLGLPVLGFGGLLAFRLLCSWVLPDSCMHLCTAHCVSVALAYASHMHEGSKKQRQRQRGKGRSECRSKCNRVGKDCSKAHTSLYRSSKPSPSRSAAMNWLKCLL